MTQEVTQEIFLVVCVEPWCEFFSRQLLQNFQKISSFVNCAVFSEDHAWVTHLQHEIKNFNVLRRAPEDYPNVYIRPIAYANVRGIWVHVKNADQLQMLLEQNSTSDETQKLDFSSDNESV